MHVRRRTIATVLAAASVGLASVPLLVAPAQAAPVTTSVSLSCSTLNNPFTWPATIKAEAVGTGGTSALTLTFSDLPGISPAPLNDLEMTGTVNVLVDGAAVVLTGAKNVTAAVRSPIPLPPVTGTFPSTATTLNVTVSQAVFTVSGIVTTCTVTPAASVGPVPVVSGALPTPTPTPTPTVKPTPTPTPTPTKTAGAAKKGTAAKGAAKFACVLQTLGSPFEYNPAVTMSGTRAKAGDSKVTLQANFTDIPGLAPLPIENGTMKITASAVVGGKKVSFAQSSTINVATKAKVPVPTLTATVTTDDDKLPVEITAFKFDFGVMSGIQIYSECTGSGKLSAMTVGVGTVKADSDDDSGTTNAAASSGGTLPKTGAGAPLLMIGLWSSAFVLLSVALFLFLPSRERKTGA